MLFSYCTSRSINCGTSEVLDTTKCSTLEVSDVVLDTPKGSTLEATDTLHDIPTGSALETSDNLNDTATLEEIPSQM